MLFLVKSAFWLGVVFSCMNWPDDVRPDMLARETAIELSAKARAAVVEKAASVCSTAPLDCMAAAGRAPAVFNVAAAMKRPERPKSVN